MPSVGLRAASIVSACSIVSVGCSPSMRGAPKPPPEFGPVATKLVGCPSMQGVYAWPPAAGRYSKGFATNRKPWEGGKPVPVSAHEMQIWIQQADNGRLRLHSRLINRNPNVRHVLAREWSFAEYTNAEYSCVSNMVDVEPEELVTSEDFGGKGIRRGFRLAKLDDGAIAVGIQTISYGRRTSIFSWGGQSYGDIPAPDEISWSWSKLALLASGDVEPAPIDASLERNR